MTENGASDGLGPNPQIAPLLNARSISWHERDIPLQQRGVRLSWLIEFVRSIYWNEN